MVPTWNGARHARLAALVLGILIFLELSSAVVMDHVVSAEKRARFETIFLKEDPYGYYILPHPYLGWVSTDLIDEQSRLLEHIREGRDDVTVVVLGGSTTASGWPLVTERYLNEELERSRAPKRASVFNLAVPGWDSVTNLQAYVWMGRLLRPDFVVIHQNINDRKDPYLFSQAVMHYPHISLTDTFLMRRSSFYRLLRFGYLLSFNTLHYGKAVVRDNGPDIPVQSRISSYLNDGTRKQAHSFFMTDYVDAGRYPFELGRGAALRETYQGLIRLTREDNATLVLTTHYLNYTKEADWWGLSAGAAAVSEEEGRAINVFIRNLSVTERRPLVDLEKTMEPYDALLQEDGEHFSEEGLDVQGTLVGKALFEILKERYGLATQ